MCSEEEWQHYKVVKAFFKPEMQKTEVYYQIKLKVYETFRVRRNFFWFGVVIVVGSIAPQKQ